MFYNVDRMMSRIADLDAVASLAEPVRRAMYEFVAASPEPVSRDAAARAVDVSRQVAAYHLDRLAADGLVDVEFRRLSGRVGPGAGRPAKLYRLSDQDHEVSIPPRSYGLAASILLEAARRGDLDKAALAEAAHSAGVEMGKAGMGVALEATGYEPFTEGAETRFRNCPFHSLKESDQQITCRLNLALVEGIAEGAGSEVSARLAPEEGYCCVRLSPPVTE